MLKKPDYAIGATLFQCIWFLLAVLETVDTLDTQADEIEHGGEDNNTAAETSGDAGPTATDSDNQQQPRLVYSYARLSSV